MNIINVADLVNPDSPTGETYRQTNTKLTHKIPLDTIVEVLPYGDTPEEDYGEHTGLRLYVVSHDRDCDQTPLYSLSFDKTSTVLSDRALGRRSVVECDGLRVKGELFIRGNISSGFAEDSLKVIKLQQPKEELYRIGDIVQNSEGGWDIEITDQDGDVITYVHQNSGGANYSGYIEECLRDKASSLLAHLNR